MAHTRAWRNFKRMQDSPVGVAALTYAGGVVHAFEALPGGMGLLAQRRLLWPFTFFIRSLALPLLVGGMRRPLGRYVWLSFKAGFGQTPTSVLTGVGLL